MKNIFPEPIRALPEANIPLAGIKAFLSQAENHQILFMQFKENVEIPEHFHAAQVGFVIAGKMEMNIGGEIKSYEKGDIYSIPAGIRHSGRIQAGYADITFFADPNRYKPK